VLLVLLLLALGLGELVRTVRGDVRPAGAPPAAPEPALGRGSAGGAVGCPPTMASRGVPTISLSWSRASAARPL
jgi:hypothetical protein